MANGLFPKPNNMGQIPIHLRNFVRGINKYASPIDIAPDEVQDAENMLWDEEPGTSVKRKGYIKIDDLPVDEACLQLYVYEQADGDRYVIAQTTSGKIYHSIDRVTWTLLVDLTDNLVCSFETFDNVLWITNGTDTPLIWDGTYLWVLDGTTWTSQEAGKAPPGEITGDNSVDMATVDKKGKYIVKNPSSDRLFMIRTTDEPSGVYFNRFYNDAGADIMSYNAVAWPDVNLIRIGGEDGIPLYGGHYYMGMIVLFKEREIHVLRQTGPGDADFAQFQVPSLVGSMYHRSLKIFKNLLLFFAPDGIYSFNGSTVSPDPITKRLQSVINSLQQSAVRLLQWVQTTQADWETGVLTDLSSSDVIGSMILSFLANVYKANDLPTDDGWTKDVSDISLCTLEEDMQSGGTHSDIFHAKLIRSNKTIGGTARWYKTIAWGTSATLSFRAQFDATSNVITWPGSKFYMYKNNEFAGLHISLDKVTLVGGVPSIPHVDVDTNVYHNYVITVNFSTEAVSLYIDGSLEQTMTGLGSTIGKSDRIEYEISLTFTVQGLNEEFWIDWINYDTTNLVSTLGCFESSGTWESANHNNGTIDSWGTYLASYSKAGETLTIQIKSAITEGGLAGASYHTIDNNQIPTAELTGAVIWIKIKVSISTSDTTVSPIFNSSIPQWYAGGSPTQEVVAEVYEGRYLASCASANQTYNDLFIVIDSNFSLTQFTGWDISSMVLYGDELMAGDSQEGDVHRLFISDSDNGVAIDAWYIPKDITLFYQFLEYLRGFVMAERVNITDTINLDYKINNAIDWTAKAITLSKQVVDSYVVNPDFGARGMTLKVRVRNNTDNVPMKCKSVTLLLSPQGEIIT